MNQTELHQLKDRPLAGVYVLNRGASILYVGQSHQVYDRVRQHLSSGLGFNSWRVVQIEDQTLRQFVETVLIQVLRPDSNFDIAIRNGSNTYTKPKIFSTLRGENTLTIEEMQQIIAKQDLGHQSHR